MPTITVSKNRLLKLVGKELTDDELGELLFNIKIEASKLESGELWELEITPDRLDMLMSEGIARVLRGVLELEVGMPKYKIVETPITVRVDPTVSQVRPYIAAAVVYGYNMDFKALEELIQAQEKLHQTLGRDRRKVAIGIHNLKPVSTSKLEYVAKPIREVRFRPLDEFREMSGVEILSNLEKGVKYKSLIEHTGLAPLFQTVNGTVLSMPPIINSELTRVTENTRDILIDVTGPDVQAIETTINLLVYGLAENAESIGRVKVVYPEGQVKTYPKVEVETLKVTSNYISKAIGVDLAVEEAKHHLEKMRFNVKVHPENVLVVEVPPYRYDVLHPIDLVEDVAISIGYSNLEPTPPKIYSVGKESNRVSRIRLVRELMTGLGFQEIYTFMLSNSRFMMEVLEWGFEPVKILNPISPLYDCVRSWLTPNILSFLAENQHSQHPIRVFEVGDVVVLDSTLPENSKTQTKLATAILHSRAGYKDVQSALYTLFRELEVELEVIEDTYPFLVEGRSVTVYVKKVKVGFMGEVHPKILQKYGLEFPVSIFEVNLSKIFNF